MPSGLSIIIPTHNRAQSVAALLRRLRDEAGWDEVIVVDDGSSVEQAKILDTYSCDSMRIFHQTQSGPATARNAGWLTARGDIVLFLDDDVVPAPGAIEYHLNFHMSTGSDNALISQLGYPNECGSPFFMEYLYKSHYGPFNLARTISPPERYKIFLTAAVSIKRSLLESTGGFDSEFPKAWGEDQEFGYRLLRAGATLAIDENIRFVHQKPFDLLTYCNSLRANASESLRLSRKIHSSVMPTRATFQPSVFKQLLQFAAEMEAFLEHLDPDAFGYLGVKNSLFEIYRCATAFAHNSGIAESIRNDMARSSVEGLQT